MATITTVRLNGRDHRILRARRPDTVTVTAGEWAAAGSAGRLGVAGEHDAVGAGRLPRVGSAGS
jgi:hypothetical protein